MLIQNVGNTAQAAPSSNVQAQPSASLELPKVTGKPAAEQQTSAEQIKSAVENINLALKQSNKNLEFSIDESTNKQVFKLTDSETGDVIRQYPTEEMLSISRAIDQVQQGLLLKQEA